jgi:hypothetical protein
MHQTFYIDIDEEITSIVEKLRKTEAPEAVIVVPKRALLIQSIVNLKLLRKEADNLGLKISIVTQDKLGKMLINKAGISVQQKLEDGPESLDNFDDTRENDTQREFKKEIDTTELENIAARNKRNIEKIGSANYFASSKGEGGFSDRATGWEGLEEIKEKEIYPEVNKGRKISISEDIVPRKDDSIMKRKNAFAMDVALPNRSLDQKVHVSSSPRTENFPEIPFSKNRHADQREYETKQEITKKDQQLENFFYANNFSEKNRESHSNKKQGTVEGSGGGFLKVAAIFGAVILVFGLAYTTYLYIPKATITIFAKKEVKSADTEITGNVNYDNIDYEKSTIPAKLMEFNEEVVKTFDSTGKKNVSNQKAKGKVTIYNEFSSSPQALVATTRFLSDDQKVFRLVQGVNIPGTTKVGEEIKPGIVEAEVVADEPGDSYNISATNFTIPGFKNSGNEKYAKIYAKSTSSMAGGGSGNDIVKIVSDKDISDAKDKISLEINSAIKNKVKASVAEMIILDDAILVDEPVYRVSNSAGETADSFEIKAEAHARALVFSESDIKKIANSVISKSGNGKINIDSGSVIVDYGKASADFRLGTIEIKMHASSVMQPNIDLENLKKGILGKNNDELAEYLKTYPSIEKAEAEYFPQLFVSKIPLNEKKVEVILNATMP